MTLSLYARLIKNGDRGPIRTLYLERNPNPVRYVVETTIPGGRGLGGSAGFRTLMPAPSIEAFLDLIHKSGVVDPTRLAAYLDKLRAADALPAEAAKLASQMVRDAVITHFQAQQLLAGKWRGFFIGKYKVLEKIGSGGMGTVYLAEHKFMKRRVAIKVLPKSRALEPSSLERFYREAKAIAALDHPNIVRAYDIDVDKLADGTELHFLVMEYVDGVSFQDLVRLRGPLDPHRAAHYIYQAAQGLHHAQLVGLVHRDIKPGNLLVDRSGIVKILDMGLARFFHDEEDLLTKKYDENVLGTADYLAPEQAIDSHTVDIRADIYSLGGTFYYLLTGRSPFGEGTVAQKLIWHQTRRPKPLLEIRPELPPDIVAVVEKMMEKSPSDRYQTPLEVAEALAAYAYCDAAIPAESDLPDLSPAARGLGEGQETGSGTGGSSPTALRRHIPGSTARTSVPPVAESGSARKGNPSGPGLPTTPQPDHSAPPTPPPQEEGGKGKSASPVPRPAPVRTTPRSSPRHPQAEPTLAADESAKVSPRPKPGARPVVPQPRTQPQPAPRAVVTDTPVPVEAEAPQPVEETADNVFTAAQEPEGEFSWSDVADTGEPTARSTDTVRSRTRVPRSPKSGRGLGSVWMKTSRRTRLIVLIAAAAGFLLAVATVLLVSLYGGRKPAKAVPEKSPKPPAAASDSAALPARNTLYVSKSKVAPDDFESIAEALLRAAPGDRILVRDQEVYEESLVINLANGLGKRNLLVEAEPNALGETAILRARGSEPILVLDRIEDFVLKGFHLHGGSSCDDLIRVTGACPGSRFEQLRLTGHRRSAVRLDGCEAVRGREVRFVECQVQVSDPPAESAVSFGPAAPSPDAPVMPNRYVQFIGCRFQGPFAVAVVQLGSPNVGILFERNIFAGNKAPAFLLPASAPNTPAIRTVLLGNTFWDCAAALKLQQRMRLDSEFRLMNNLFYRLGTADGGGVGVIENEPDPDGLSGYIVGEGNVYDSRTPTGNLAAVATVKLSRLSFDLPISDPTAENFLRYPADSPLNSAGSNGQPVGALPPLP